MVSSLTLSPESFEGWIEFFKFNRYFVFLSAKQQISASSGNPDYCMDQQNGRPVKISGFFWSKVENLWIKMFFARAWNCCEAKSFCEIERRMRCTSLEDSFINRKEDCFWFDGIHKNDVTDEPFSCFSCIQPSVYNLERNTSTKQIRQRSFHVSLFRELIGDTARANVNLLSQYYHFE